jgi:hypothetical protein
MIKYLRVKEPKNEIPRHNYVGYIHGLDPNEGTTLKQYLKIWKNQEEEFGQNEWDKKMEHEAIEALTWLIAVGLAKVIDKDQPIV